MHNTEECAEPVFCHLIRDSFAIPLNVCSASINLCRHLQREIKKGPPSKAKFHCQLTFVSFYLYICLIKKIQCRFNFHINS